MKMIKEGNLKHKEKRTVEIVKIWINTIEVPPHLEFSKLCLMVEQKL